MRARSSRRRSGSKIVRRAWVSSDKMIARCVSGPKPTWRIRIALSRGQAGTDARSIATSVAADACALLDPISNPSITLAGSGRTTPAPSPATIARIAVTALAATSISADRL